jgi:predicted transcriptional regulator
VKEEYGGDKTYWTEPTIEEPERAIEALYALARGHAMIKGRTNINVEDLPVVIDVALSSAPWERIITLAYLLNKGKATTNELMKDLKCSRTTAIRKMETLKLLELVDLEKERMETSGGEQLSYTMKLREDFKWFTTAEFKKLWRLKVADTIKTEEIEEELETQPKLEAFAEVFPPRSDVRKAQRARKMLMKHKGRRFTNQVR